VLDRVAPRSVPGVTMDLTQTVSLTVPPDPYERESSSYEHGSSHMATSTSVGSSSGGHQEQSLGSPPSYEEALRTSRPAFIPPLTQLRRCFTDWDMSRPKYHSNTPHPK